MNNVVSIKERREVKNKPFLEKLDQEFEQIHKIEEMMDRDVSEMNNESAVFYFKQLFGKLRALEKLDRECVEEYNKAYNKNEKATCEMLDEIVRETIESGEEFINGEDPEKE